MIVSSYHCFMHQPTINPHAWPKVPVKGLCISYSIAMYNCGFLLIYSYIAILSKLVKMCVMYIL